MRFRYMRIYVCVLLYALLFFPIFSARSQHAAEISRTRVSFAGIDMRGYFVQGGIALGKASSVRALMLEDLAIPLGDGGNFIIGFNRDEQSSLSLTVVYSDGRFAEYKLAIARREYDIQRIDGLPPKQVTPPAELLARIRRETAQIVSVRKLSGDWQDFSGSWLWPARGRISGVYGSQRILNGEARRPHYGVDIAAAAGTVVIAPAGGLVRLAEDDFYYSGGTIIIDHGHGLQSSFLHMASVDVSVGDFVKRGDRLGTIGATGRATGAHLDWRVNWNKKRVDAQFLLPPRIISRPR